MSTGIITLTAEHNGYYLNVIKSGKGEPTVQHSYKPRTRQKLDEALNFAMMLQQTMAKIPNSDVWNFRIFAGHLNEELLEIKSEADLIQTILALG